MKYPDYKYVDTAFGSVKKRNKLKEVNEIILPDEPIECYQTFFQYDDGMIDHFKKTNSVSKFQGNCISDFIPIDIDNSNLNESLRIGREFVNYLYYDFDVEYNSLGIYFSGSKGFHIQIPTVLLGHVEPSMSLPLRYKNFVLSFDNWGFDTKIYEKVRLWRIENSINSKSGLYKIRLHPNELLTYSIKDIKALALVPRDTSVFTAYDDWDTNQNLLQIWENTKSVIIPKTEISFVNPKDNIDFLSKGVAKGDRNNTLFRYTKKLKNLGYAHSEAIDRLSVWNYLCQPPLTERELKRTIQSVYSFNISDSDSIGIRRLFRDYDLQRRFNSVQRDIFVQIVSRVNTQPKTWEWEGKMHHCDAGEMICSNQSLAKFCGRGVSRDQVRYSLDKFEKEGMIIMQRLNGKNGKLIKVQFLNYTQKYTPDKDV